VSLNLVLDNLRRLMEDAAFIIQILIEHEVKEKEAPSPPGPQPSSTVGHGTIGPPHIHLEEGITLLKFLVAKQYLSS
jgi:hypothetical protein